MSINGVTRSRAVHSGQAVAVFTILSALATWWLPPVGAACFVATTAYAWRRLRRPLVTAALVILTLVAVLAAPGVFVSAHGTMGRPAPAPAPTQPANR
jgi:hypothetical protein